MSKYKFVGEDRIESEHWAVELVDLDEGRYGEYNEDDPEDYPHLRFDYYSRPDAKSEWEVPDDSSYCCLLNSNTITKAQKRKALKILLNRVLYESYDIRMKRIGEEMSWLNMEDVK